jgi:hypothetical protein
MPTYTVKLRINVPTEGERAITQTGIVANTLEAAIRQAKDNVIIETVLVDKTAN